MSSTLLTALTIGAGMFTVVLGLVHLAIPRIVGFRVALGVDEPAVSSALPLLGTIGSGRATYQMRRTDLLGIAWVMSNAASYVLITIGLVDLAWAAGWRVIPIGLGAAWIAGWWGIRALGQLALGRRRGDWLAAAWFAALGAGHVAVALGAGSLGAGSS